MVVFDFSSLYRHFEIAGPCFGPGNAGLWTEISAKKTHKLCCYLFHFGPVYTCRLNPKSLGVKHTGPKLIHGCSKFCVFLGRDFRKSRSRVQHFRVQSPGPGSSDSKMPFPGAIIESCTDVWRGILPFHSLLFSGLISSSRSGPNISKCCAIPDQRCIQNWNTNKTLKGNHQELHSHKFTATLNGFPF